MARPKILPEALTVGQLAARWSVNVQRVKALVTTGKLPGAFQIPSAGRYGATVKIPLAAVLAVEQQWAIGVADPNTARPPRPTRRGSSAALRHFPELAADPLGRVAESPASEPH